MSIRKQQSSIVEKMAGKQCRLLLFFVVPVLLLTIGCMLYGLLGSYREEAEAMIVQLENDKIALEDLKENSRVKYRIISKKEKIEIFISHSSKDIVSSRAIATDLMDAAVVLISFR